MKIERDAVSFTCPKTGRPLDTGIKNTPANLARWWRTPIQLECPHCKGRHSAVVRDIYVAMTVAKLAEV